MAKQAAVAAQTIGEYIDIGKLHPSPTNPRKRFYADTLDELAASIADKGVIEPLIVRLNYQNDGDDQRVPFEIVCGERRFRASQLAKLEQVPCIVRELTDDEVLDIQIHENLHREDVHPMDEAYGYQFLLDKLKCTVAEVAARVGKSEKYVLSRLKLNSLIPEAQEDLEKGHLLLTYALEIAKFSPDIQKQILDNAAYEQDSKYNSKHGWEYFPVKEKRAHWSKFTNYINETVLRLLSAAPFDRKATNLRSDGLACVACPERTGANAGLFEAEMVDKKDSCLNPGCFAAKKDQHAVNVRQKIAHEASIGEKAVPFLRLDSYNEREGEAYGKHGFIIVGKKPYKDYYGRVSDATCDKSVTGVNISDGQYGKSYEVCLKSTGCKVHYPGASTSSSVTESSEKAREKELKEKRKRREELIDVRVGNEVRARVFRHAAEKFNDTFTISGGGKDLMPLTLAKMWTHNGSDDGHTKNKIIRPILASLMGVKEERISFGSWDRNGSVRELNKLSPSSQNKLFFLLVHGNSGAMYYDRYESQQPVKDLAEEYGVDYRLLDAEERLKWAEEKAKKHAPIYKVYLDAVRAGDTDAKIPRPYEPTYKPKD